MHAATQLDTSAIDLELDRFLSQKIIDASTLNADYAELLERTRSYLLAGGKRIRPYLYLLAYHAYGGTDSHKVLPLSCSWELIHAAMLVHDDIIDRDTVRHGRLNIHGAYAEAFAAKDIQDGQHLAESNAILAGDFFIASAFEIIATAALDPDQRLAMITYLNEAIFRVVGGEFLDVQTAYKNIGDVQTEVIMKHKTAGYSFELPLASGAQLAGAPDSEIKKLRELGEKVGVAFQLIDDLLGIFGDAQATGKSVSSDIEEKKKTLLVTLALENLNDQDQAELEAMYAQAYTMDTESVVRVKSLLQTSGAVELVQSQATRLTNDAKTIIDELDIHETARTSLRELVIQLLERDK